LSATAIFGAASAAQASGSKNDADKGGARKGPQGQAQGAPSAWRGRPSSVHAYVPRSRLDRLRGRSSSAYAPVPKSRLKPEEGVNTAPAHSSKPPEGGSGKQ
jgi:hypothetical protein